MCSSDLTNIATNTGNIATNTTHIGTNTVWYASVWLAPERDLGLFTVTNAGGDDAARATEAAVTEMIARLDRLVGS